MHGRDSSWNRMVAIIVVIRMTNTSNDNKVAEKATNNKEKSGRKEFNSWGVLR